jgi:16S rRNA (cytidine1402-2'-O)-methyltransferase
MPLFICGTPIGNLEDISLRVLRLLKEADVIAAEDTRHTKKLLSHYEISAPLISYHEHSGAGKAAKILELLKQGKTVALVSDAGMPLISDPGEELVRACIERDIEIIAAPGPTAATTALVLSGLAAGRFIFEGFLPQKNAPPFYHRTSTKSAQPYSTKRRTI